MGRKRPGFSPEWGEKMQNQVLTVLNNEKYDFFVPNTRAIDDATVRMALEECKLANADVLVVLQPTMSDGRLAVVIAQVWKAPLVLWATPENPEGDMISACSLVGTHAFAATLRQFGHPFEVVYGNHDWLEATSQLQRAVRLAALEKSVRNSKVGLIGYHAPGFIDMHPDPFLLNKTFGIQLQHMGIVEFMDTVNSQNHDNIKKDLQEVAKLGIGNKNIDAADLGVNSKYYLALKQIIAAENFDAFALRCWPELPNVIGHWPYLALSRLVSEGVPLACEGDVDGALCALFAKHLGLGSVYLTDWLEHSKNRITIWHGGMAPLDLSHSPMLAKHFNSQKPMVVDANINEGEPITLFRIWNCDNQYHLMSMQGETEKPERKLMGSNGVARIDGRNLLEFFADLCHLGMPHHLAIVRGHQQQSLKALARRFHMKFVE